MSTHKTQSALTSVARAQLAQAEQCLSRSKRRRDLFLCLRQPMTAKQLSRQVRVHRDACSQALCELRAMGLVSCLNPSTRRSRLYWPTRLGRSAQRRLLAAHGIEPYPYDFPRVNWNLYGWVCYSHRASVVKILSRPMQPATIKREARSKIPGIRMSANNVRDIIREFLPRGIVNRVPRPRKSHPLYELTECGKELQRLLKAADIAPANQFKL